MYEAKGKRTARATLGARKRARVAPATTANSSAPAQESPGLTVASLAGFVDAPLPVSLPVLLATAPTATPLQVEAGAARVEGQPSQTNAELLDAADELQGTDYDDEAAPACRAGAQDARRAQCTGIIADSGPHAQAATNTGPAQTTRADLVTNWTVRNAGKVVPPTCNDYSLWTVVQLRKECAERKSRLGRKVTKSK
ncbi:hypothetical protein V7S43_007934 [Phytophthora oleae]|uniref:Pectate lyase n=1 Tax=Phytophthora oleae TaxID=2107226 RepID=A0ABD3FKW4_9STRA